MPRVSIPVTCRDNAHRRVNVADIPSLVTNPRADFQWFHRDKSCLELHHGLQAKVRTIAIAKRRYAKNCDAGTDPVFPSETKRLGRIGNVRPGKRRRCVRNAHCTGKTTNDRTKLIELLAGLRIIGVVGTGKMRHDSEFGDRCRTLHSVLQGFRLIRTKAQAVHAGIEFQPDSRRPSPVRRE